MMECWRKLSPRLISPSLLIYLAPNAEPCRVASVLLSCCFFPLVTLCLVPGAGTSATGSFQSKTGVLFV